MIDETVRLFGEKKKKLSPGLSGKFAFPNWRPCKQNPITVLEF